MKTRTLTALAAATAATLACAAPALAATPFTLRFRVLKRKRKG